jgi:hypothetical protein
MIGITTRRFGVLAGSLSATYLALLAAIRSRHMQLGATGDEASRPLPGDPIVADAQVSTRGITIHAPAAAIWPWLVQMGQDRAGFYSYDVLERLAGAGIHNADHIVPEWQDLKEGDLVRTYRYVKRAEPLGWFVESIERDHALVVRSKTSAWSWALVLEPLDGQATRLLARTRARRRHGIGGAFDFTAGEPAHLIMEFGVLRGVKHRAEANAASQHVSSENMSAASTAQTMAYVC